MPRSCARVESCAGAPHRDSHRCPRRRLGFRDEGERISERRETVPSAQFHGLQPGKEAFRCQRSRVSAFAPGKDGRGDQQGYRLQRQARDCRHSEESIHPALTRRRISAQEPATDQRVSVADTRPADLRPEAAAIDPQEFKGSLSSAHPECPADMLPEPLVKRDHLVVRREQSMGNAFYIGINTLNYTDTAVPEPATWPAGVVSLTMVGFSLRRSQIKL